MYQYHGSQRRSGSQQLLLLSDVPHTIPEANIYTYYIKELAFKIADASHAPPKAALEESHYIPDVDGGAKHDCVAGRSHV